MTPTPHDIAADVDDRLGDLDELLVVRPRPRPMLDTEIDITPMIDMVFLLLIFFLVTSSMSQTSDVQLPEAVHGDAVDAKEAVIVTVAVDDGGNAAIYKGDGVTAESRVLASDFVGQEDELVEYIKRGIAGPPRKQHVLVKAAGRVAHGQIARVYAAAGRAAAGSQLYVAVIEAP
jgi:biopolymer transport protein ExbD